MNDQSDMFENDDHEPDVVAGETKSEAFLRIANKRLPVAVKRIRLLGNLSSANYSYTDEQAALIIDVLRTEVDKLESKLLKESDEYPIPVIT
jgi:hypothetical protein